MADPIPAWRLACRFVLAGLGLLAGQALHAAADDDPARAGVWQGTLGEAPGSPGACEREAFYTALERPARVVVSDTRLDGRGALYRTLALDFDGRNQSNIGSFELLRDGEGVRRFNALQREALNAEMQNAFDCARSSMGETGQAGQYDTAVSPVSIGRHWLVSISTEESVCGGPHPNAGRTFATWDLDAGIRVDPWTWFDDKGAVVRAWGTGDDAHHDVKIGETLMAAIAAAWPRRDDCDSVIEDGAASSWDAYPSRRGMVFMPQLPHAAYACTEEVVLPWARVIPLLTAAGRKTVQAIRADFARPPAR